MSDRYEKILRAAIDSARNLDAKQAGCVFAAGLEKLAEEIRGESGGVVGSAEGLPHMTIALNLDGKKLLDWFNDMHFNGLAKDSTVCEFLLNHALMERGKTELRINAFLKWIADEGFENRNFAEVLMERVRHAAAELN